jgi:hypothetical protein
MRILGCAVAHAVSLRVAHAVSLRVAHAVSLRVAHAVSLRLPTAATSVRARVRSCGICGGQYGTGGRFSPSTLLHSTHYTDCCTPIRFL